MLPRESRILPPRCGCERDKRNSNLAIATLYPRSLSRSRGLDSTNPKSQQRPPITHHTTQVPPYEKLSPRKISFRQRTFHPIMNSAATPETTANSESLDIAWVRQQF